MNLKKYLPKILVVSLTFGLFLVIASNYYYLSINSVNIPVGDEWEALNSTEFLSDLNWNWIFTQHNEHRIIFTKLHTYLLYKYNHWDIATQIAQNYFIYLSAIISLWAALYQGPTRKWAIIAGASIFLFSASIRENFIWGFQSQFHFAILFSILSAILLTSNILTWKRVILSSLFSIFAIYSFSSGLPMALSLVVIFAMFSAYKYFNFERSPDVAYKCGFFTLSVVIALTLYFSNGYHQIEGHPKLILPIDLRFWEFFIHLVGAGFSVPAQSAFGGLICTCLVFLPVSKLIFRDFSNRKVANENWTLLMLLGLFSAALASIALGRAGFGNGQAYSSRYVEFGAPMIVIGAVAWHRLNPISIKARNFMIAAFLVLLVFHRKQFSYNKIYDEIAKSRVRGIECLKISIGRQDQEIICSDLYPWNLQSKIQNMRILDTGFGKGIKN